MILSRAAALLLVVSVTLGQRVYWDVSGNPVDLFAIAFVAVALLLWTFDSLIRRPEKLYRGVGFMTVGPFFALFLLFPLLGVATGWYRETSLYLWMVIAVPLAVLSLGRSSRLHGLRLDRVAFSMIVVHGVYGLAQALARVGIIPGTLWAPAAQWDAASQAALSEAYVISGRSTGLFINANVFGLWSCGAILVGAVLMKGWMRYASIVLGILGVVGSQSRTALVGLAILILIAGFRAIRERGVAKRALVTAVVLAPIFAIAWGSGAATQLIESDLVTRLGSALDVITGGVAADNNLAARVDAWDLAFDFANTYPFGTLGPPQALFGTFIDNEYVSLFLQGSILLVAAYIIALLSPIVLARRGVPMSGALGVASVLVAVASFTMLPVESTSSTVLIWLLGAAALAAPRKVETKIESHAMQRDHSSPQITMQTHSFRY